MSQDLYQLVKYNYRTITVRYIEDQFPQNTGWFATANTNVVDNEPGPIVYGPYKSAEEAVAKLAVWARNETAKG